jgi:hypothetical protein
LARSANATIFVPRLDDIPFSRAQLVVLAALVRGRSEWSRGRILTRFAVLTEEAFKGESPRTLEVVAAGGKIGGIAMRVAGYPELRSGDRSILLLRRTPGFDAYRPVGGPRAFLHVQRDAWGRDLVDLGGQLGNAPGLVPLDRLRPILVEAASGEARPSR